MACKQALPWGTVLLTRHLWEQMNLSEIIRKLCPSRRKRDERVEAHIFVATLCERVMASSRSASCFTIGYERK